MSKLDEDSQGSLHLALAVGRVHALRAMSVTQREREVA